MEDWHNFSAYYDPTLMAWFKNFEKNWDKIKRITTKDSTGCGNIICFHARDCFAREKTNSGRSCFRNMAFRAAIKA